MGKCRDCEVCTRSAVTAMFYAIFRMIYAIAFSWNYGLFKKKCPDCGHFLSKHRRRKDGSFRD